MATLPFLLLVEDLSRLVSPRVAGVVFLMEGVTLSSTGFEVRGFFDGVDEGARPSQRDRFEGGVVVGVGIAAPEFGLGK